ncbi:MAG: alpha/beta fold hydrolase [Pyrinomonadaceae bacterium]
MANIIRQASLNGLVGGANALAERPDLRPVLPTIRVPTLVLFGEEDSLTPVEVAQMLHAAIPDSELAIIRNASHAAILEKAPQANGIIRRWTARVRNER